MTLDETRQMAIEFERRIQTAYPETSIALKLDTETIDAFLNESQTNYIKSIYVADDQFESGTRASFKIQDVTKSLITRVVLNEFDEDEFVNKIYKFKLPDNYYSYIRSSSRITSTYKGSTTGDIPNMLVKQSELLNVSGDAYNKYHIIRKPFAVLNSEENEKKPYIYIYTDKHTTVTGLELIYYKIPNKFSVLNSIECELSIDCFEDIVNGAVAIYMATKLGQALQNKQQLKKEDDE